MFLRKRDMGRQKPRSTSAAALFLILLTILSASCRNQKKNPDSSSPSLQNVILISLDDLRADRLGCYGNPRPVSPVMDSLAAHGVQFNQAYTAWPFTPPAHIAMLTSLYPSVFEIPLDPGQDTLASILNRGRWTTAAFTGGGFMSSDYGTLNGFSFVDDELYGPGALEKRAGQWLRKSAGNKFFLFLHTYYQHVPFEAPEKDFDRFRDPAYDGPVENTGESTNAFIDRANKRAIDVTDADIAQLFAIYDAQICRLDEFIAFLIGELKNLKIDDETLIILTSDHGEQFFEHGYIGHTSPGHPTADASIRVPLIIYVPGRTECRKIDALVELIDVPPTILGFLGLDPPDFFQGTNLAPLITGKNIQLKPARQAVFQSDDKYQGIRTSAWKLLLNLNSGDVHLYDLQSDPKEQNDLGGDPDKADIIAGLLNDLTAFQNRNEALKKRLKLSSIKLAEGVPSEPHEFDAHTRLLIPCDDFSFELLDNKERRKVPYQSKDASFSEGLFDRALELSSGTEFRFPIETPLMEEEGSLELWIRPGSGIDKFHKILDMRFDGLGEGMILSLSHIWSGRFVLDLSGIGSSDGEIRMTGMIKRSNWNHLLVAWDKEKIYFFIDGILTTWIINSLGHFPPRSAIKNLTITGELCLLDDIRLSDQSRVIRKSANKPISPEVRERLRSLGYIR